MINVNQITSQLARMPDQALQKYAMLNKNDPYTVSLALSESNRRKAMREGAAPMPGQMPKVVDQDIAQMSPPPMQQMPPQQQMPQQARPQMPQQAQQQLPENTGIGQLPAQNMQRMADGGIVGYAEGGVPRFNGMTGSVPQLGYEELAKLYQRDPGLAREAALRAGPMGQQFLTDLTKKFKTVGVPAAVLEGGMMSTIKAASDLSKYTTPEQRREMSSNPMLSAMSGDAGAAAATMDAKRNNPSGASTTPYLTQMSNVAGAGIDALGAMGKHLISAPGYGFSGVPRPGQVEPGRIAMPQSTISGTGDTTEIDNLAAQMQTEKAKTKPTTTGGQPTRPSAGANVAGGPAAPAAPAGGITALPSEADTIKRFKEALGTSTEPTLKKGDFLKELNDISQPAYDKANAMVEKEKGRLKEGKEQDFYMALIEGGLAAASESSPNGIQNIAKGFSKGAASYREGLKDFRKASQENAKMELELSRAQAADKKGDIKSYYDHQEKALDRQARKDDRIAAGISSIISTTTAGQFDIARATVSGEFGLQQAKINKEGSIAASMAPLNLMTALGTAKPDSALRKGFDLQTLKAHAASLQETWSRQAYPTGNMGEPNQAFLARYPTAQKYINENMEAMGSIGTGGFVQPPPNATILPPKK